MAALATLASLLALTAADRAPSTQESLTLRGKPQVLHVYGSRGGPAAMVASGDGGWVHLAPHVAEVLAGAGYFVVGFDSKAYLSSFTTKAGALSPQDVPADFRALVDYAQKGSGTKPLLVGVSEGAGLAVLAATDRNVQAATRGVVALGLPDRNELGWRWRDSIIYLTKKVPDEPTFSVAEIIGKVAPLPLAALHSTHDEFVPLAEIKGLIDRAAEPKRLWVIEAQDHRFSGNVAELDRRLLEALEWIKAR